MKIQSIPVADSPNNEAFEGIVELYFQICGYITSSGKWFWVKEENKRLRGYQDIDVLAIDKNDVLIVSVTSNLDDKLRRNREGNINYEMISKLVGYFGRIEKYLESAEEYKWLVGNGRRIRRVVAYNHAFRNAKKNVIPELERRGIEVIAAKTMLRKISNYIDQPHLKIQDQMLRIIQIMKSNEE